MGLKKSQCGANWDRGRPVFTNGRRNENRGKFVVVVFTLGTCACGSHLFFCPVLLLYYRGKSLSHASTSIIVVQKPPLAKREDLTAQKQFSEGGWFQDRDSSSF